MLKTQKKQFGKKSNRQKKGCSAARRHVTR